MGASLACGGSCNLALECEMRLVAGHVHSAHSHRVRQFLALGKRCRTIVGVIRSLALRRTALAFVGILHGLHAFRIIARCQSLADHTVSARELGGRSYSRYWHSMNPCKCIDNIFIQCENLLPTKRCQHPFRGQYGVPRAHIVTSAYGHIGHLRDRAHIKVDALHHRIEQRHIRRRSGRHMLFG